MKTNGSGRAPCSFVLTTTTTVMIAEAEEENGWVGGGRYDAV